MDYPRLALKVRPKDFSKLVALGTTVSGALTGNVTYTNVTPAVTVLDSNVADCATAIGEVGPEGNRGSHAQYLDLTTKAFTLWQTLKDIAASCTTLAGTAAGSDMVALQNLLSTTGYDLANAKSHHGLLLAVENFHVMPSPELLRNQAKLKWKRPLDTNSPQDVSFYEIYRSLTTNFADAVKIGSSTRTSFVDTNISTTENATYTYFVRPFNSAGGGAVSSALTITLLPA